MVQGMSGPSLPARVEQGGALVERLSTAGLPLHDQYPYWKESICDLFVGLDASRPGAARARGGFHAEVARRRVDLDGGEQASFMDVTTDAQYVARSSRHIRASTGACLMLALQAEGMALFEHEADGVVLAPGDMILLDTTRPYRFRFGARFRQFVLKVPRDRLAARLPRSGAWLGRPVSAASPLGGVLTAHLGAVAAALDALEPALRPALVDRTLDLIALTFAGALRDFGGAGSTVQSALVARARLHIEARLGDPALSAATVAAALGISQGYLHRLFHGAGSSVGDHIRDRRFERCRAELADPLHAAEHVTEIALRWGFNDMPHFSRAFRKRFGIAPRDYRARALGAPRSDLPGRVGTG
jgi:AraC-like DNA-binding protein